MTHVGYKTLALTAAILTTATTSYAAGGWSGAFELGAYTSSQTSDDTDIDQDPFFGASFGVSASRNMGSAVLGLDFYAEGFDPNGAEGGDETSGTFLGVLGAHYGWVNEGTYTGIFGAYGQFDGYDDNETDQGFLIGLEGAFGGPQSTKFGQIGYASIVGDKDDNEFNGPFARVGYASEVGNGLAWNASIDFGYSDGCFEDCGAGEFGYYSGLRTEVSYDISDRMEVFGAYSYRYVHGEDSNDATGTQSNIYIGLRMPFGGGKSQRPGTPIAPFEAANWMEQLD